MRTFSEKERCCEATFFSDGPYWHAYSPGKETPLLFIKEEDFVFVMNVIAQAAALTPRIKIIAFEVMGNHFHFILAGCKEDIESFWDFICKRLSKSFPIIRKIKLTIKPIESLKSLRNSIVYTNRNGYVANPNHTPFSYPWGTGHYYFLQHPDAVSYSKIKVDPRREMFRGRAPLLPDNWQVSNGHIVPSSYCSIVFGMSLFHDAHQYFAMVSKNIEAYQELAVELDDDDFLTDAELFTQIIKVISDQYGVRRVGDLSKSQRYDLARSMRHEWHTSNDQIRRILNLSAYEVNSLFPLGKK